MDSGFRLERKLSTMPYEINPSDLTPEQKFELMKLREQEQEETKRQEQRERELTKRMEIELLGKLFRI